MESRVTVAEDAGSAEVAVNIASDRTSRFDVSTGWVGGCVCVRARLSRLGCHHPWHTEDSSLGGESFMLSQDQPSLTGDEAAHLSRFCTLCGSPRGRLLPDRPSSCSAIVPTTEIKISSARDDEKTYYHRSTLSQLTLLRALLTENAQLTPAQVDQWRSLWHTSCNEKNK